MIDILIGLSDPALHSQLYSILSVDSKLNIYEAKDGNDLWDIAKQRIPELIITDHKTLTEEPEIFARLRSRPSTKKTQILLICTRDELNGKLPIIPDEVLLQPLHPMETHVRLLSLVRMRKLSEHRLENSRLDPLTAVFTRSHWLERLNHELARAERYGRSLALLILDIDNFGKINNDESYSKGDQMLREVARALVTKIRGVDLVARVDDDEFSIVLPETSLLVARPIAERIHDAIHSLGLTCSMGVSGFPHQEIDDISDLLRIARLALSKARDAGGDQFTIL